ncbi:hypothetical protein OH779_29700 [Actinacidiphila glaucinigra]|uniref:hypothetical protein n=1 Tax=Actinacidiphila glaucinigra TaxID=235986 RepID=UPI00386BAEE3
MNVKGPSRRRRGPYGNRQRGPRTAETEFPWPGRRVVQSWEHTMTDLVFVVTTIAVFALVALIAKAVARL